MAAKAKAGKAVLLPGWHDVRIAGGDKSLDGHAIMEEMEDGNLLEYAVTHADGGTQGLALVSLAKPARTTRLGTWFEGVHVAASDRDFGNYMRADIGMGEHTRFFHRCTEYPCRAKAPGGSSEVVHCPKFRLLQLAQLRQLSYGQAEVSAYEKLVAADDGDVDASTMLGAGGKGSGESADDEEDEAAAHADLGLSVPKGSKVPAVKTPAAKSALHSALAPRGTAGQPQLAVDRDMALRLANADAAVAKAGGDPTFLKGGGLGALAGKALLGGKPVVTDAAAANAAVAALALKAAEKASAKPKIPDIDGEPLDESPLGTPRVSQSAPGVILQARLLDAASSTAKRKSALASSGSAPAKRRVLNAFISALSGAPAGAGTGLDDFEGVGLDEFLGGGGGGDDDDDNQFFRGAPSAGIPQTTPVLAERRPGDVCASGLERIRGKLSAFHGDAATTQKRVMMLYYETVFKPGLERAPPIHHEREMKTICASLDQLIEGDLARVGDLLMGRMKALEEALSDGSWDLAREYEVLPQRETGITTDFERQRAAALQMRNVRLRVAMNNVRSQGNANGRRP